VIKHALSSLGIALELLFLLFHLHIPACTSLLADHQVLKDELDEVQEEAQDVVSGLHPLQPLWVPLLFLLVLVDELLMREVKVEVPDLILDEPMRGQGQLSDEVQEDSQQVLLIGEDILG
jgi:hypothetical protein